MPGELESFGDAVTGGVLARAVEPRAGDAAPGADGHTHESACLNCGTKLRGEFCHACGQKGHVHRTLGAFGHDLLHGVLHFEGKVWRTLPMLAWHPGQLTRRYIEGERARFVSPLALFLFSIFLMFAIIGWTGGGVQGDIQKGLDQSIAEEEREIAEHLRERAGLVAEGKSAAKLDKDIADHRADVAIMRQMRERGFDRASMVRTTDEELPNGFEWLEKGLEKAQANPSLLLYKLQTSAYKYSWALIPISVPFMWLLFPFSRKFRLYDHTVFVTYSLCFMTLLAVVLTLLDAAGGPEALVAIPAVFVPPIHMYRQLRGAYGLRRRSAALRAVLLVLFAGVAATIFGLILLALGVLG